MARYGILPNPYTPGALVDFYGTPIPGGSNGTAIVETINPAAASQTLDYLRGNWKDVTMTANTSFTLSNLPLGGNMVVTIRGAFSPTFTNSIAWQPGPSAPSYADGGTGMTFQFFITKSGEIRGSAIVSS